MKALLFGLIDKFRRPRLDLSGPYPNGSVPAPTTYDEDLELRTLRFECAARNHNPRSYTGSWCMGFGYSCDRCHMFADPVSRERRDKMYDEINASSDSQTTMARLSGGGPPQPKR